MTMFSMKPKFDLAAFLAVPAKPGTFRRRVMTKSVRPAAHDEDASAEEAVVRNTSAAPSS